jgi:hypothetical protein
MVLIAPFVGAAVFLSGVARALPTSDYSSGSSGYGSSDSSSNYGSSDSSSNYGSSDSSSNYGSSDSSSNYGSSGYGSSGSNYGSSDSSSYDSNNYDSSSANNYDSTTANNYYTTSSTYEVDSTSTANNYYTTSSTANNYYTSTSSTYEVQATSTSYGSGSSYWGGSGYEDCVNQCVAQFGGSSGGGSYQATATVGSAGSTGTGATWTVLVAPTQGVLRMMPFATNASVGDTIEFHWGANEHTVTKSSVLTPCNKSLEAPVFASGEQNKSFVFSQVVNDTNPTFYYCGTPTHCEKGMFGVINPATTTPGSPSSVGGMMQSMAANDSDLSAYAAYASNVTSSNDAAAAWGENMDLSAIPSWAQSLFATNVLYTRAAIAMNSEILQPGGSIDLSSVSSVPLMLPMDLSTALNAAAAAPASSTAAAPAGDAATAAASPAASASASATPKSSGAISVASPRMLVGAMVVLATIFAL